MNLYYFGFFLHVGSIGFYPAIHTTTLSNLGDRGKDTKQENIYFVLPFPRGNSRIVVSRN